MVEFQGFRSAVNRLTGDPLIFEVRIAECKTSPLFFLLRRRERPLSRHR
jgi:hypothetical protein